MEQYFSEDLYSFIENDILTDENNGWSNEYFDKFLVQNNQCPKSPSTDSSSLEADPLLSDAQLPEEQSLLELFDISVTNQQNTQGWIVPATNSLLSASPNIQSVNFSSKNAQSFGQEQSLDFAGETLSRSLLVPEESPMDITETLINSKDNLLHGNNNTDAVQNLNESEEDGYNSYEDEEVVNSIEIKQTNVSPLKVLKSVYNRSDTTMNLPWKLLTINGSNACINKSEILLRNPPHFVEITFKSKSALIIFKNAEGSKVLATQIVLYPNMKVKKTHKQIHRVVSIKQIPLCKNLDYKLPLIQTNLGAKIYLCPANCMRAYIYLMEAKLHSLKHLKLKPYKCDHPNCIWEFYTPCKLARHKETHEKVKNFLCSICDRSFTTVYNLNEHKKKHSRPANLKCPVPGCDSMFQTEKQCLTHCHKTHKHSEAPFPCTMNNCTKSFFSRAIQETHIRACRKRAAEVICPTCQKVFNTPYRLREHSRQHSGIRPYRCDYNNCNWSFTTSSKLRRHQNTHVGDRKYHCKINDCQKAFLRAEHLKEHTFTHIVKTVFTAEKSDDAPGKTAVNRKHPIKHDAEEDTAASAVEAAAKADFLLQQAIESLESDTLMTEKYEYTPAASVEVKTSTTVNLGDLA